MHDSIKIINKAIDTLNGALTFMSPKWLRLFILNVPKGQCALISKKRIRQARCLLDLIDGVDSELITQTQFEYLDDLAEEYGVELFLPPYENGKIRPFFDITNMSKDGLFKMKKEIESVCLKTDDVHVMDSIGRKIMEIYNAVQ